MDGDALTEAMTIADAPATTREAAAALRARFEGIKVVVVDAFDMRGETPVAAGERRALYFGASDGHCWQVTSDPTQVSGLFLAERS